MTERQPHNESQTGNNEAIRVSKGWLRRTKDNLIRWLGHASFLFTGETLAALGALMIASVPWVGVAGPIIGSITNLAGESISGQGAKNSPWGEKALYITSHIAATATPLAVVSLGLNPIFIPISGGIAFGAAAISMRNRLKHR